MKAVKLVMKISISLTLMGDNMRLAILALMKACLSGILSSVNIGGRHRVR
jgi:hypothetical protein